MATKTLITAEQYLGMTFEHDAEFVHGEIVERSVPDYIHARIQALLTAQFEILRRSHQLYVCSELRLKLAADVYRIPDVCVFAGDQPRVAVPSTPPLRFSRKTTGISR